MIPRRIGAGFTPVGALLRGPSDGTFFAALREAFAKARAERPSREYLLYSEWDELFKIAEQDGIVDYHREGRFATPFGMGLLRLWRAIRDAKANAIPANEFMAKWDADIDARAVHSAGSTLGFRPREDREPPNSRRTQREDPDDDELPFKVQVGA